MPLPLTSTKGPNPTASPDIPGVETSPSTGRKADTTVRSSEDNQKKDAHLIIVFEGLAWPK